MTIIYMDTSDNYATSERAGMDACKLCLLRKRELWESGAHKVNRAATRSQTREGKRERIRYGVPFIIRALFH